jgi:hypothetical protein
MGYYTTAAAFSQGANGAAQEDFAGAGHPAIRAEKQRKFSRKT